MALPLDRSFLNGGRRRRRRPLAAARRRGGGGDEPLRQLRLDVRHKGPQVPPPQLHGLKLGDAPGRSSVVLWPDAAPAALAAQAALPPTPAGLQAVSTPGGGGGAPSFSSTSRRAFFSA